MTEIRINYQRHNSGKRGYDTYSLHLFKDGQPVWTTYISREDYERLDRLNVKKM